MTHVISIPGLRKEGAYRILRCWDAGARGAHRTLACSIAASLWFSLQGMFLPRVLITMPRSPQCAPPAIAQRGATVASRPSSD